MASYYKRNLTEKLGSDVLVGHAPIAMGQPLF